MHPCQPDLQRCRPGLYFSRETYPSLIEIKPVPSADELNVVVSWYVERQSEKYGGEEICFEKQQSSSCASRCLSNHKKYFSNSQIEQKFIIISTSICVLKSLAIYLKLRLLLLIFLLVVVLDVVVFFWLYSVSPVRPSLPVVVHSHPGRCLGKV